MSPIRQHRTELETCQLICIRANMMVDTVCWSSRRHANMRVATVGSRANMKVTTVLQSPCSLRIRWCMLCFRTKVTVNSE